MGRKAKNKQGPPAPLGAPDRDHQRKPSSVKTKGKRKAEDDVPAAAAIPASKRKASSVAAPLAKVAKKSAAKVASAKPQSSKAAEQR